MSSLIEQYKQISAHLDEIVGRISKNEERIKEIDTDSSLEIQERIVRLEEAIKKVDEYLPAVLRLQREARKHLSSDNVPTIETYPGYKVNLNRLERWMRLVDLDSADDPYAQRVLSVAKCDEQFLRTKRQEFVERIEVLRNDNRSGLTRERTRLEEEINTFRDEINRFLDSPQMTEFYNDVRAENARYSYSNVPQVYSNRDTIPPYVAFGAYEAPLHLPKMPELNSKLKALLGDNYNETTSRVRIPFIIDTESEFIIDINCISGKKGSLDKAVRSFLLQIIDRYPAGLQKVYFIDAVKLNSRSLNNLKSLENTFALAQVPKSPEQVTELLQELVSQMADVEEDLGDYDSWAEFYKANKETGKQVFPRSTIVLYGWDSSFESEDKDLINRLLRVYDRYGFSFIIINYDEQKKDDEKKKKLPQNAYDNSIRIEITQKNSLVSSAGNDEQRFIPYMLETDVSATYIDSVKSNEKAKKVIGSVYTERYNLTAAPVYKRGNKTIEVPYGVDTKDGEHSLSFTQENFAMYLMGSSGSGKSTLLHTIITGILRKYHPDDVELWLADFKMGEFAQYINPMPPHVKYILLDESRELVYDLIDKLTAIMMERQKYFMIHRDKKKVEEVNSDEKYMPIIFVILDEFSIMSQSVSESEAYRLKLQNLLAKGRALGIKFIFSSQTFASGIIGLTKTAKDQIQMRVAMRNAPEEVEAILELAAFEKTEQVKNWISAFPPHYALIKYRDGDINRIERYNVMYFNGKEEELGGTYSAQRKYIELINQKYKPVDEYAPSNVEVFVDKNPVVVDGNSYTSFYDCLGTIPPDSEDKSISFGSPRLLVSHYFTPVTDETRENILLIARNNEVSYTASIMLTVIKLWLYQKGDVEIWAYERNPVFLKYRSVLESLNATIFKGMGDVCRAIKRTKERIQAGKKGNKMIVLIGMERLYGDFSFFGEPIQKSSVTQIREKLAEQASPQTAEEMIKTIYLQKYNVATRNLDPADKETKKIIGKRLKAERDAELAKLSQKENSDQQIIKAERNHDSDEYNAAEDFSFIVKQGSRFGIHFFLHVSDFSEIKEMSLNQNLFRHKLSFQLSIDDSRNLFNSKIASQLPEHVCQYSNMIDSYSFRPYLHEGVEWDGWTVDENKNVVSPFAFEN